MAYSIPFVNPKKHYYSLKSEIDAAITDCLSKGDLIYRQQLCEFENHLASFVRVKYAGTVHLVRFDAHRLPFANGKFDVVILFEAVYYLASPGEFLAESRRVLRKNGALLICTVNKDWSDFNPSPFSVRYLSGPELAASLREKHFEVELFGAYLAQNESVRDRVISAVKRAAIALDLMPKTMRKKEFLKRIFFGELTTLPPEIGHRDMAYAAPTSISCETPVSCYKIIYAIAHAR